MAFTDNCSVFAALSETAFNRVVQLAMLDWPSDFNYATQAIAAHPNLLCQAITADPNSPNPQITVLPPLPIIAANGPGNNHVYGLDYCFQVEAMQVDFSPGDAIALPPPLAALGAQRMAVHFAIGGGLSCPPDSVVQNLNPPTGALDFNQLFSPANLDVSTVLPTTGLICFRFDAYVVVGVSQHAPPQVLNVHLYGLKLQGLLSDQLESIVECYLNLLAQLSILPRLKDLIPLMFTITPPAITDISLKLAFDASLTASPAKVPNNPAFEDEQVKVFADVQVRELP